MRKIWIPLVLTAAASIVSAQTLVEHATAAAGGTAAAAAGKKVSDGIDTVFGALGGVAKDAAGKDDKSKPRRSIDPTPPLPEARILGAPASNTTPIRKTLTPAAGSTPAVASKRTPAASAAVPAVASTSVVEMPVAPAVPARPSLTASDIAAITPGESGKDLAGKLGKPASRVTMDDDGKLVEIYSYRSQGATVGTVRVVDGQVTEVRPAK